MPGKEARGSKGDGTAPLRYARPGEEYWFDYFYSALYDGEREVWLYIKEKTLVAVACISNLCMPREKRHIAALVVCPGFRKKGVAKAFLSAIKDKLKKRDVTKISVCCFQDLAVFWQRVGFLPVKTPLHMQVTAKYFECLASSE